MASIHSEREGSHRSSSCLKSSNENSENYDTDSSQSYSCKNTAVVD